MFVTGSFPLNAALSRLASQSEGSLHPLTPREPAATYPSPSLVFSFSSSNHQTTAPGQGFIPGQFFKPPSPHHPRLSIYQLRHLAFASGLFFVNLYATRISSAPVFHHSFPQNFDSSFSLNSHHPGAYHWHQPFFLFSPRIDLSTHSHASLISARSSYSPGGKTFLVLIWRLDNSWYVGPFTHYSPFTIRLVSQPPIFCMFPPLTPS